MMMHQRARVRLAQSSDLDFVSRDGFVSQEVILHKIEQEECFVLEVGGQYAGYLRLEFLWSLVPYISLVMILEEYRKKGYSRHLLGFVENNLKEQGFDVLYSSSQSDEPTPQAWHRHMGFEECGIITGINAGGIGEIFFRKAL